MNEENSKIKRFVSEQEKDSFELGQFYFLNGKYKEAIASFSHVLELNKHNEEALYNLGLIYENQNQKDAAVKMFERAVAINPEYKIARHHLDKIKGLK